jgi:nucleotide-binding universal stress UspA family protein
MVPLDGSIVGEHALPIAVDIARRAGAALHFVHVHALDLSVLAEFPSGEPLDMAIQEAERAYLASVAARVAANWDGPVTTALCEGTIATALHDYVLEQGIDLVVMTTHGRGGIVRAWLGNIADTLVRTLPVPVLLAHPHNEAPELQRAPAIAHILVPLDGSPLGEQVLEPALALGGEELRAITLLHTVEPIALSYMGLGYGEPIQRAQKDSEEAAYHYLELVAERIRRPGLTVLIRVEIGAPAPSTLYYAGSHDIDMIALATHGRGGIARFALGSIADKVARGTSLPVLLYHPNAQRTPADAHATHEEHAVV